MRTNGHVVIATISFSDITLIKLEVDQRPEGSTGTYLSLIAMNVCNVHQPRINTLFLYSGKSSSHLTRYVN